MPDETLCARCGRPKSEHAATHPGDPRGLWVYICPTAIFDAVEGPHAHANAVEEVKKHIRTE